MIASRGVGWIRMMKKPPRHLDFLVSIEEYLQTRLLTLHRDLTWPHAMNLGRTFEGCVQKQHLSCCNMVDSQRWTRCCNIMKCVMDFQAKK